MANVTAAKPSNVTGAIYVDIAGTATLPTDTNTAITGFENLGFIGENGVVHSTAPTTEAVKCWGGDTVLTTLTAKSDTFQFTLLEALNENVLKLIHDPANVSGTLSAGLTVKEKSAQPGTYKYVIDMILDGNVKKRICIPAGTISNLGDVTYSDSSAVAYDVTVSCAPDSTGVTHYEYIK